MAIVFYNQGEEHLRAGSLEVKEIKAFPLFVRPNGEYQGEYGFDYVRTSACAIDSNIDDESICNDVAELDKQYEIIKIKDDTKYHIPWLCMFPNHKNIIGKDVIVTIIANAMDVIDITDMDDNATIELKTSNSALRGTPDTIRLNDDYSLFNSGIKITITCDQPISKQEYIEFRLKSKFLTGKDKDSGLLVGKINVVKNNDYAEYKVPAYTVFACLEDQDGYEYDDIMALINDSKVGGLQGIEDYLNKRSLNQALIQVKITNMTNPRKWEFTWNNSLKQVSKGINPDRGAQDNVYKYFRGLIVNQAGIVVDSGKYFRYTHSQFTKMSFNDVSKRGAIIYLSSLNTNTAGGSAAALPTNNRQCIVYKSNLKELYTYAHELGHVFGLCHPFLERDSSGNEMSIQDNITYTTTELGKIILNVQSTEVQNFNNNTNYYNSHKKHEQEDRTFFINYKKYWQDYQNEFAVFLTLNSLRFEKGKTQNIMDYDIAREKNKIRFTKRQWEIMQDEVKKYYNDPNL